MVATQPVVVAILFEKYGTPATPRWSLQTGCSHWKTKWTLTTPLPTAPLQGVTTQLSPWSILRLSHSSVAPLWVRACLSSYSTSYNSTLRFDAPCKSNISSHNSSTNSSTTCDYTSNTYNSTCTSTCTSTTFSKCDELFTCSCQGKTTSTRSITNNTICNSTNCTSTNCNSTNCNSTTYNSTNYNSSNSTYTINNTFNASTTCISTTKSRSSTMASYWNSSNCSNSQRVE